MEPASLPLFAFAILVYVLDKAFEQRTQRRMGELETGLSNLPMYLCPAYSLYGVTKR